MEKRFEANFDGIVGPTHNYRGLSPGNFASLRNKGAVSSPKAALKQALSKAKGVADLGIPQFVLPPHERPHVPTLRKLGFSGTDAEVIEAAFKEAPHILAQVSNASAMWTANAATVAPSVDTMDGRLHLTPASLGEHFHRSLEGPTSARILRAIFSERIADVHDPLPLHPSLGDEGAANHMRFAREQGDAGVHLFVYGQEYGNDGGLRPKRYPARQTLEASRALARQNRVKPENVIYAQQNPEAIDAGVFHNDVIAVNGLNVWLLHKEAYVDTDRVIGDVRKAMRGNLHVVMADSSDLSFHDAERSYVFNSQILHLPDGRVVIVVPQESMDNPNAKAFLDKVVADTTNPIDDYMVFNVTESMRNGGGPACLRLRVVLSEGEIDDVKNTARVRLDTALYNDVLAWGDKHYRDRLMGDDLKDPKLLEESRRALDELTQILNIGSVYEFQK